jgi:hypothetical protein
MKAKTFVTVQRFDLSADTREEIQAAAAPLFETDNGAARVDITIEGEYTRNTRIVYNVTVRAQAHAEIFYEMIQGEKILPAVKSAVSAVRRKLVERGAVPST